LSSNFIPPNFLETVFGSLEGSLIALESINLSKLKDANKIDWTSMLGAIGALAACGGSSQPIRITLSDYQIELKRQVIFEFMAKTQPNIQIVYA
jgi:hypothetical protein